MKAQAWQHGVPVPGVWTRRYPSGKTANVENDGKMYRAVALSRDGCAYRSRRCPGKALKEAMAVAERIAKELP